MIQREITQNNLKPVRLINTHCHIDHVFGNKFVSETYNLPLEIHEGELPVLKAVPMACQMYGIPYPEPSPMPGKFIKEGGTIEFGNTKLQTIFTPGHSPASISFFCEAEKFIIAGDVLFYGSIGRTDLPGGDFKTLISVIKEKLFPLGDDVKVYSVNLKSYGNEMLADDGVIKIAGWSEKIFDIMERMEVDGNSMVQEIEETVKF